MSARRKNSIIRLLLRIWLSIIARPWQRNPALDRWNAEMSAEMCQVNGTDGARDGNEIDLIRSGDQDGHVPDCQVIESYPDIGSTRTAIVGVRGRNVLPSCSAVLLPNVGQDSWIVHSISSKPKMMNGNAVYACDDAPKIWIVLIHF